MQHKTTTTPPNRRTLTRDITVRKQGARSWAVYADGELIEGGFFSRDAALSAAAVLHEEYAKESR